MVDKVQNYIKELLYDNDCVIIPELGGFVTSYQSSEVHPVKHHFTPPSKRVAFNEKLKLNDGLLISYIANSAEVSLQEATKWVNDFVSSISAKIKAKEKVIIDGIGSLMKNQEGRLQFKAELKENYLDESFGLPDFFAEPIVRDDSIKLRNKFKDRKAMSKKEVQKEEQSKEVKKKKGGATIWVLSTILVLLSCSAVYLFLTDHGRNSALSSMLPWGNSVEAVVDSTDMEIAADTVMVADTMMEADTMVEVYEEETVEEEAPASSGEIFLSSLTGRYYVIAGGFSVQENAITYRDELIAKGYDAKVLSPLGVKPLFRVSIADYATQQEGIDKSGQDNPEFGNTLWVMKY